MAEGAQAFYSTDLIERSWHGVKQRFGGDLPADVRMACESFVRGHSSWNQTIQGPRCFSHNDFRLDNLLFGGADGRVATVDWQTSAVVGEGLDAAYFICGAFDRETRKIHEHALLVDYHGRLQELGVTDYPLENLLVDCAHYSFAMMAVGLVAMHAVERTERGDALFLKMISSSAYQAMDNRALDLLVA